MSAGKTRGYIANSSSVELFANYIRAYGAEVTLPVEYLHMPFQGCFAEKTRDDANRCEKMLDNTDFLGDLQSHDRTSVGNNEDPYFDIN